MESISVKIIIVDDHAMVRQGLRLMLGYREDFIVIGEVEHADQVIEKIRSSQPDIVLMDINLPGKSGIELTAELKYKMPSVKVLALTAVDDRGNLLKMIKAGALGYILKDVHMETLYDAIETVARGDAYISPPLLSEVLAEFREAGEKTHPNLPDELGLTQRELEVIYCIANGESNIEIARKLFISSQTVKNHVSNILRKLKLEDRTQIAVYVYRQGMISH